MNMDFALLRLAFPLSLILAGIVLLIHPVHATIIAQPHSVVLIVD